MELAIYNLTQILNSLKGFMECRENGLKSYSMYSENGINLVPSPQGLIFFPNFLHFFT